MKITEYQLTQALWQVYHHMELENIAQAVVNKRLNGNDNPEFKELAKNILRRIE